MLQNPFWNRVKLIWQAGGLLPDGCTMLQRSNCSSCHPSNNGKAKPPIERGTRRAAMSGRLAVALRLAGLRLHDGSAWRAQAYHRCLGERANEDVPTITVQQMRGLFSDVG